MLYWLKKASENWSDLLKKGIERRGYLQYQVDPSVFYRKDSFISTYVDDCVIFSNKKETITSLIGSLNNGPENDVLTHEGYIKLY